ncbi:MAG: DUF11 domain-containing protein [Prevotellaceae bacterium]|nr:DUF11 domain-containing protein [Prevotellaceae bacterium]
MNDLIKVQPHKYVFAGDTGLVIGYSSDTIGWKKAKFVDGLVPVVTNLPSTDGDVFKFKAQDKADAYKYEYKYSNIVCKLDTSLFVSVWIKKKYKPTLKRPDENAKIKSTEVDSIADASSCVRVYEISNMPYVVDLAETGSPIDTIQIDTVWRIITSTSNVESKKFTPDYNSTWTNATDTLHLKDGDTYTVAYGYRYNYAHPDSISYDTVEIAVPYYMYTVADLDTISTSAQKSIDVLKNDTISQCLLDLGKLKLLVNDGSGGYGKTGATSRGGEVKIEKVGKDAYVEYISATDYQGLDTFTYQIQDTSTHGMAVGNVKTDTVVVRVEPRYALSVTKAVDSVVNRKGVRSAGDPNLDSMFVGDTAYFTVTVANIGKNTIKSTITIRDTFPDNFGFVASDPTTSSVTARAFEWTVSNAELGISVSDSMKIFHYSLVARNPTANPALAADTNRVDASVSLKKNTFDSSTDTLVYHSDTVLLKVYESIDVSFTQKIDTSTVSAVAQLVDTLVCDSLYQKFKLVLTAKNVGSTPLTSITIVDTIPAGVARTGIAYYIVNENGDTASLASPPTPSVDETTAGVTIYTWSFSTQIGTDSALQIVIDAMVSKVDTFRIKGCAFEQNKMDIDSMDNYGDTLTVIFKPEINLIVEKYAKIPSSATTGTSFGLGNSVEYNIVVTNSSQLPLYGVEVRDTLFKRYLAPQDIAGYEEANDTLKWDVGDSSFVWTVNRLGQSETDTLKFYVTANARTDNSSNDKNGALNSAYAYLPLYYGTDSVYFDSVRIKIVSGLDLQLTSSVSPPNPKQGDTVTLMLKITNASTRQEDSVINDITVCVKFSDDDSLRWINKYETTNDGNYAPSSNTWTISARALGMEKSDSITFKLVAGIKMGYVGELGGYIINSYIPEDPAMPERTKNDTSYAHLNIEENPVNLSVTKKVTEMILLEKEASVTDTIAISVFKSKIDGIRLVDTLPPNVIRGSVHLEFLSSELNNVGIDTLFDNATQRYVVTTKNSPYISLSAHATATMVVHYSVNSVGDYPSVVRVYCDSVEATLDDNVSRDTTHVYPMVDLQAKLTAEVRHPNLVNNDNSKVIEGDTIIYTLVVSHDVTRSNADAENVTLAFEPVPSSVVFISATHLRTGNQPASNTGAGIVFNNITVKHLEEDTIKVLARVKPNAATGGSINWRAYLSCASDIVYRTNDTTTTITLAPQHNSHDVSVSITPVDTFFYLSQAQGSLNTPSFNDSISIRNLRDKDMSNVKVEYTLPAGLLNNSNLVTSPKVTDQTGNVLKWTFNTIATQEDTAIIIYNRTFPYTAVNSYKSRIVVLTNELEADPDNNVATETASVIYDVNLKIDSIGLINKNGATTYTQGDTISVTVKLTNKNGCKTGQNVVVNAADLSGFTLIKNSFTYPASTLAPNDVLYSTLEFRIDTFTNAGDSLRFHIAAHADTSKSGSGPSFTVRDSAWSLKFPVSKGADACVWIDTVVHEKATYSNLSYAIAVTNNGQYKATGVTLYHEVPDTFYIDSVHIAYPKLSKGNDTTLIAPPGDKKEWDLGIIAANRQDTARITLYVTSSSAPATLPIAGYIACSNDKDASNDTIRATGKFENERKIEINRYHLKVTKTTPGSNDPERYDNIQDTVAYTVEVKNIGLDTAYGVRIVDTIPGTMACIQQSLQGAGYGKNEVSYVSGAPTAVDTIIWVIDTIAPDSTYTLTFNALAHEAGQLINTAQIVDIDTSLHPFDPDPKNRRDHRSVDSTDVRSQQSITIIPTIYEYSGSGIFTSPKDTLMQGDTVVVQLNVTKTFGNEKALGIRISLDSADFKGKLTFISYFYDNQSEGNLAGSAYDDTTLVWTLNLDTGNVGGVLTLVAIIGADIPAKGTLLDSLTLNFHVKGTKYYPKIDPTRNSSAKIYITYCDLDLKVEVHVAPTKHPTNSKAVYAGIPFEYNIYIANLRGKLGDADSITLVDTLPSGISFTNNKAVTVPVMYDTSYHTPDGRLVLRWHNLKSYLGSIEDGGKQPLVLENCRGYAIGPYPNKAQIFANRHEATLSNNSSSDTAWIVDMLELVDMTFVASQDTVTQGDELKLYITVKNYSERTLTNFSVKTGDLTPSSTLRYISDDKGGKWSSANIFTWSNDSETLRPGDTLTITLTIRATGTGTVKWPAVLYVDDNVTERVKDTATLVIKQNPYDIKVTKTASQSIFNKQGSSTGGFNGALPTFQYTIKAENIGEDNATATNVIVRDTLPAGIDTASAFATENPGVTVETVDGERRAITFYINELQKYSPQTFTIDCKITDTLAAKSYLNHAYVTCNEQEASPDNNADTAMVEVRDRVNLKVKVTLCDENGNEYDGNELIQGNTLYAKVSVVNNGKDPADSTTRVIVTLSDKALGNDSTFWETSYYDEISSTHKINSDKSGEFSVSAVATAFTKTPSEEFKDSVTTAFSILPGADMQIAIEAAPPATPYSRDRAYTISLTNAGTYRADTVALHHTLDPSIVSLNTINIGKFFGGGDSTVNMSKANGDTLFYKIQNHEALTYSKSDSTLVYSIDAVQVGDSASITLFVTTAEPKVDTTLTIEPFAEVLVFADRPKGNNRAYSNPPIVVHPNPYNVSVSITPKRIDMRNISGLDATSDTAYTITAKNIGKRPAGGVFSYRVPAGVVIRTADSNSDSIGWEIFPWLSEGDSVQYRVTVGAQDFSSKGSKKSFAHIKPEFTWGEALVSSSPETDLSNNRDTAYLNLYSVLDSWKLMEAFSPNGDGKNDRFVIHDLESDLIERAEIVIVNRYGSEVYYHRNYKEAQLDESAAFTGAGLPEGSYFYQLTVYFKNKDNSVSVDKRGGAITLRRSRWK